MKIRTSTAAYGAFEFAHQHTSPTSKGPKVLSVAAVQVQKSGGLDDVDDVNGLDEERGHGPKVPFVKSHGLTTVQAEELLKIHGTNELHEKVVPKWFIFLSQLWQVFIYLKQTCFCTVHAYRFLKFHLSFCFFF
jgi:hypothetical protein